MFSQIDRYIARLTIGPIIMVLAGAVLLLLLENMYRLFSFTLVEGQPLAVVWRMLGSLVPEYLALGIPLSLLLGIMLAFRRLALANELDALQTVGFSYLRLLKVPMMMTLPMVALTFVTVGYIQPIAEYGLQNLLFEVRTGQFGLSIKLGELVHLSENTVMQVRNVNPDDDSMTGIFARIGDRQKGGQTVITAQKGKFLRTTDSTVLLLRLHNGQAVQRDSLMELPRVVTFAQYDVPVHLPEVADFRSRGGRNTELILPELIRRAHDSGLDHEQKQRAVGELHRRLILIVLPFVIPLLAMASAVPPKRSSSPVGMILGFSALIVLFKVLDFGATATSLPVVALLWGAYAAFAILSVVLFYGLNNAAGAPYLDAAYIWSDRLMDIGADLATVRWSLSFKRLLGRFSTHPRVGQAKHDLG